MDTQDDTLAVVASADAQASSETSEVKTTVVVDEANKDTAAQAPDGEKLEADAGDDASDKPKSKSGVVRQREKIAYLEARIAQLEAPAPAKELPEPKLENFADYSAFESEKMKWEARQVVHEVQRTQREEDLEASRNDRFAALLTLHDERVKEAAKVIPDFGKVMKAAESIMLERHMTEAILESDKSALLQHHLALKPELVTELNRMDARQAARRIGQIEATLSYPKARTESQAPAPVSGLRGGSSPNTGIGQTMTDYAKWRNSGA